MVVGQREIVEECNEDEGVGQKATCDVGIRKSLITHRIIIQTYDFIDLDLAVLNFRLGPYVFAKGSQPKLTIVTVSNCVLSSLVVLGYFVSFNVLRFISSY